MSEEEIDIEHYSKVVKKQARNESDELTELKRKIEDNQTIKKELTDRETELLKNALKGQSEMLEKMASKPRKVLEDKLDEADQN